MRVLWRWRWLYCVLLALFACLCITIVLYFYISLENSETVANYRNEILWWADGMQWKYDEIRKCGAYATCRVTNNRRRLSRSKAILFYGSNIKAHDFPIPRQSKHIWALLHEESPRNVPFVPYDEFLQHFNYTSTFSRYSTFPLTTQYLPDASDLTGLDLFIHVYNKRAHSFNLKLAPVVFLQTDCNTMSGREDYVRELMQHIKVDSYGGCLHNRDFPNNLQKDYLNNLYSPDLLIYLSRYKFMIAIENGVCEDYITEKFWRPLIAGVIPIYFGSPSIRDWQPHKKSAIYIEDFPDIAKLVEYLEYLNDNDTAYNEYLEHKLNNQRPIDNNKLVTTLLTRQYHFQNREGSEENSLFRKFECFVCQWAMFSSPIYQASKEHYNCPLPPKYVPLQDQKEPKYASDWRSMMKVGHCQAQILDKFWRANRKYTKQEFDRELSEMVVNNKCN